MGWAHVCSHEKRGLRAREPGLYCKPMIERTTRRGATPAVLSNLPMRGIVVSGFLVLAAFVLSVALGGCSEAKDESGDAAEALPPVIAEVSELDGATFEINESQPLVVNAPDPVEWTGTSGDPEVAVFVPGTEEDGGATYNPSFEATGPGETVASMTSPEGESYDFKLVVK